MAHDTDDLHPALREALNEVLEDIRGIQQEQDDLDRRWAAAHLSLRKLVGSDSKVGKALGYSAATGRNRLIKAREIRDRLGLDPQNKA